MKQSSRVMIILTVLASCIGSDQLLKQLAKSFLQYSPSISFLDDIIRFQYAENRGVMMSIGASLSAELRFWIFVVIIGMLLVSMLAYVVWNSKMGRMHTIAWSLMVSGGLGNLIDRLSRGGVVIDYVSIGVGVIRTAVFNLADVCVFLGVFLLLVHGIRKKSEPGTPSAAEINE